MMSSNHRPLPLDPGPVPASLRDAFALSQDATRASSPLPIPDEAALAAFVEEEGDDDARSAMVEQLLASPEGMRTLAHLVAARTCTIDTQPRHTNQRIPPGTTPLSFATTPAGVRRHRASSALKPILLAASLMLVSSTSWYVFSLPSAGENERSLGTAVELQDVVQPAAAAPITLTWKSLRTSSRYRVEVLDPNDDPVFATETNDTTAVVPRASLKPGPYRWWVRSRATDGTEIRSRVEKLTVR